MIELTTYGPYAGEFQADGSPSFSDVESIIRKKSGLGNDYLGWLDYVRSFPQEEYDRIAATASRIRRDFDALVVVGIGGSYLGARAAIEAIKGLYPAEEYPIYFIGETLSPSYTAQLLKKLEHVNFAVNVISKSGTTTEPAVAFRLLKELIVRKRGAGALKKAIVATTDKARGALKNEADKAGYECFVIPDDVGGRYSVITPVGLLPMAVAGLNISAFLTGVKQGEELYSRIYDSNPAYQYGARRYYLYRQGYSCEMFVSYEPQLQMFNEWLKQLFGESEGKDSKGLLPTSCIFTTDLHSMGQFIQEGSKVLFETVIRPLESQADIEIPFDQQDLDGLNYLQGQKLSFVNTKAFEGTLQAHSQQGHVPVNVLTLPKIDEFFLGELMYFFMRACAFSAYLLEVNPFNQPGVEVYKSNMFDLLGKPKKN